jgi:hypothetical protein
MLLLLLIELIIVKFYDLFISIKNRNNRKIHLYGINLYVGLYGQGKTISMVDYLQRMRKRYGSNIKIATNFYYNDEDFRINTWHDLLPEYDTPVIFAYDEIQNDFNSRDYKNFPTELLTLLTQNRKGNGKQIIATAQRYTRVDKVFRELTSVIIECNCLFGRLVSNKYYDWFDYEQLINAIGLDKKTKVKKKRTYRFIQYEKHRNAYDSFQTLQSAKSKEYMDRTETIKLL